MKRLTILIAIFISSTCFSQKIRTNDVIKLSEKLLIEKVGPELIKYFEIYDGVSNYKLTENRFGFVNSKLLKPNRKLKNKWTEIWIFYHFNYPETKGVRANIWIKLNKNLELIEPLEFDFIPKYVWENDKCNFIGLEKAEIICAHKFTKSEFIPTEPLLKFDYDLKKYIYTSLMKLTEQTDKFGRKLGETEIIKLDAITGDLIDVTKGYHGLYVR